MAQAAAAQSGMQFDDEHIYREPFSAYVLEDTGQSTAREIAERRGWSTKNIHKGGLSTALRLLGVAPPSKFLVVDIDGVDQHDAMNGLNELSRQGSTVIAIGSVNDVNYCRSVMRAGARDYLVKPFEYDTLASVFVILEQGGDDDKPLGRVVGVLGARGGVGVSTVAINTACIMADRLSRRTALVDMDLYSGTIALSLDIEPTRGLREVFDDPERVDEVFLQNAMAKIGTKLHVLATEEAFDDTVAMTDDKVLTIADTMRANFDMSIFDLPRHFAMREPKLFTRCDDLVLVAMPNLQCLRDVNRLTKLLQTRNSNARIHVVLNRMSSKPDISLAEFEAGIEGRVRSVFPEDIKAMQKSALSGVPLVSADPKHRMAPQIHHLCIEMAGVPEESTAKRGLFGLGGKRR